MYDDGHEPDEDDADRRDERPRDPAARAREKVDGFRMHAELAAVFEGCRKFDAALRPGLDPDVARDVQRQFAKLEKAKAGDTPVIPPPADADAAAVLDVPAARGLATNDYHLHRRPGETVIVRWLRGDDEVGQFYERLQAHFDAALNHYREEERQAHGWRQDRDTLAYLAALDQADVRMADRYLRDPIRRHGLTVLSTQAADEIDILYLCDHVMGVEAAQVVGPASAPPDAPTDRDRAWFFKLFSLRAATPDGVERMCFFTFLQKAEDTFEGE